MRYENKHPVKVGLVGCGAQAKEHLVALRKMNDVQLIALCDVDEEKVAETARQWNVGHYYTKFSDMLENENLSLVAIITPPESHLSLIIEAINHQLNLLVEKPLTLSTSEADLILTSLRSSKVKLTVNYNVLFSKRMLQALSLIAKGDVGEVYGMEVKMLDTPSDPMAANQQHWSHKLPGGRFGEMLSHPVYLMQSVLGSNLTVDRVIAEKRGNLEWMAYDELHVMLRSSRGVGHAYCSFNAPRQEIQVEIFGSKKVLRISIENQTLVAVGNRTPSKIDSARDCLSVSATLLFQTAGNALTYISRRRGESAIQTAYKTLIESISTDRELIVKPEMAQSTVRITEEICSRIK